MGATDGCLNGLTIAAGELPTGCLSEAPSLFARGRLRVCAPDLVDPEWPRYDAKLRFALHRLALELRRGVCADRSARPHPSLLFWSRRLSAPFADVGTWRDPPPAAIGLNMGREGRAQHVQSDVTVSRRSHGGPTRPWRWEGQLMPLTFPYSTRPRGWRILGRMMRDRGHGLCVPNLCPLYKGEGDVGSGSIVHLLPRFVFSSRIRARYSSFPPASVSYASAVMPHASSSSSSLRWLERSPVTDVTLEALVACGLLPPHIVDAEWVAPPPNDRSPSPPSGYMVSFTAYHLRCFSTPANRFVREVLHHLGVGLHVLAPNGVQQMAVLVALWEGYLRIDPECNL
nr:unnamed protein product [Digitaria exilis]